MTILGNKMNLCEKNHRYAELFKQLPDSQSPDQGRHLCAGCAYNAGHSDGLNNKKRSLSELDLPFSQAGTVRHKSAQEAYNLGWEEGNQKFKNGN